MRVACSKAFPLFLIIELASSAVGARGETISAALAAAYTNNPDLNQERALTRATDEEVSRANSGYRPQVKGTASLGYTNTYAVHGELLDSKTGPSFPTKGRLEATESLFDGNRTTSRVARAESNVFEKRELTRDKEQQILQQAAAAYMDVLRDTALLDLRKNDVELLIYRLREARARNAVGEVTPTDIAQVASFLATARSNYFKEQAALFQSIATYRRIIGSEPKRLEAARPIDALLPTTLSAALVIAFADHPQIHAALHAVDVALDDVHVAEGALYPTLSARGGLAQLNEDHGNPRRNFLDGDLSVAADVPLYTGGADYAAVREAKERLVQARLKADAKRDEVRARVVSTWAALEASKELIQSAQAAVKASETAFVDVRAEAAIGQRTTLDLLRAIQAMLAARVSLISAQRDRVVAGYDLMAAVGRLSASNLGLGVEPYDPTIHFDLVKDKWIGLRTPEGQ